MDMGLIIFFEIPMPPFLNFMILSAGEKLGSFDPIKITYAIS